MSSNSSSVISKIFSKFGENRNFTPFSGAESSNSYYEKVTTRTEVHLEREHDERRFEVENFSTPPRRNHFSPSELPV